MQRLWGTTATGFASTAVDVSETEEAYTIGAELPGVKEKDVEVSVSDDMLVIKGQKEEQREDKDRSRYLSERSFGTFQRMFSLPRDADSTKIDARFQDGVLIVTVPKSAKKQETQKVEVKAA